MLPAAPVTSSTMTFCPSVWPICSAITRPTTSVGPPAANGTTMVIGRDGYSSAVAATMAPQPSIKPITIVDSVFIALISRLKLRKVDRRVAIQRAANWRQRIFQAGGAIKQHHLVAALDPAVGEALLIGRVSCRAFRAHQKSLLARNLVERFRYRLVGHRDGKTAALAHRAQDQKIADRLRHADAGSDGVRVLPARRVLLARLVGAHHRRAARGLHRDHARALVADEADRLHFGKRLPHADQAGAAAGRIEDDVGYGPAELLGELQAHRFLAFDAIRLLQGRDVEPADFLFALADDLAAIVDQAIDAIDCGALDADL